MLLGGFVGAIINTVAFYCFIVLSHYVVKGKLDLAGEWGGNFIGAIIGFIFGGIIGSIIGLIQPKPKKTIVVTVIVSTLLMVLQGISFFSSDDFHYFIQQGNYWRITFELISWALFVLIFAFNSWVVARTVSTSKTKPFS